MLSAGAAISVLCLLTLSSGQEKSGDSSSIGMVLERWDLRIPDSQNIRDGSDLRDDEIKCFHLQRQK
jgi:hypothetical protein